MGKYYCIKQHDAADCGAACLATILKQHGKSLEIAKIRELTKTDKHGTTALGLVKAAEALELSAKVVRATPDHLFQPLPYPAIAHVVTEEKTLHYVVIHKANRKQITVADPGKGIVYYSPQEFSKMWTGILILMVPKETFVKGNEIQSLWQRFIPLLRPSRGILLYMFLASVIFTLLGIASSFYFQYLIDEIVSNELRKTLHLVSAGVLVLILFRVLLSAFRSHLLLHFAQKLDISLVLGYYRHVMKLPMDFFDKREVGEIVSRVLDAQKIRDAVSQTAFSVFVDTVMVLGGAVVLFIQSRLLFFVALGLVPLYLLVVWLFSGTFRDLNAKTMEQNAKYTSQLVESLSGMQTIKSFNAERQMEEENESRFIKVIRTLFRLAFQMNVQSSIELWLKLSGEIIILWVGAIQVLEGNMTVGQLITFNLLLAYFLEPLQNLISLQPTIQEGLVAVHRLWEILDLDEEENEERQMLNLEHISGDIRMKGVSFRYGSRKLVLKDIDLEIRPGEAVGFVGESGSGKSTLVNLLLGYYSAEKGEILIDGHHLNDIDLQSLRERIAFIPQETFIFSGTIRENIALGRPGVSLERVVEAAKAAQLHDFINSMEFRYETHVGEHGVSLSGGQKQRLAIARALLKEPDVLIMDEATSNLDTITEAAIHETITRVSQNMTSLIIAHRLSTVMRCDKIFVLHEGQIVEQGDHATLMAQGGYYRRLWQGQIPLMDQQIAFSEAAVGGDMAHDG